MNIIDFDPVHHNYNFKIYCVSRTISIDYTIYHNYFCFDSDPSAKTLKEKTIDWRLKVPRGDNCVNGRTNHFALPDLPKYTITCDTSGPKIRNSSSWFSLLIFIKWTFLITQPCVIVFMYVRCLTHKIIILITSSIF